MVIAGEGQPPVVHALAAAINESLGNVGKTVSYTADPAPRDAWRPSRRSRAAGPGDVETLVIVGGNPVYDAPADLDFAAGDGEGRRRVIHLAFEVNETSLGCEWHLVAAGALPRALAATRPPTTAPISITQPLIEPMIDLSQKGSPIEFVAALGGSEPRDGFDRAGHRRRERRRAPAAHHLRVALADHPRRRLGRGRRPPRRRWPRPPSTFDAGRDLPPRSGKLAAE